MIIILLHEIEEKTLEGFERRSQMSGKGIILDIKQLPAGSNSQKSSVRLRSKLTSVGI